MALPLRTLISPFQKEPQMNCMRSVRFSVSLTNSPQKVSLKYRKKSLRVQAAGEQGDCAKPRPSKSSQEKASKCPAPLSLPTGRSQPVRGLCCLRGVE
ncbi:hypothetical protein XELAEV_18013194mg [Xenopus laevis]|uniref:Uncharacterized protein n=1 Tax=Xenopus laevis TaxID=8355 RepID=A0A974HZ47_XENLA|nr:hypothetical protein XELAEV_18013194mg [Xenopus laevis]